MILARVCRLTLAALACLAAASIAVSAQAWEPTRPVELIVPAGVAGPADQMARTIQGIITKHSLMRQPIVVINKGGGAGGEGFLDMKAARGNPHKIMVATSNVFTTPLATGIPFGWKDLTPVAMLGLDEFVLWVNANKPYRSTRDYIAALKAGPSGTLKMGGTGSKQEDQVITVAIEQATGGKFTYVPFAGGSAVAVQLGSGNVDSSVSNPIEAVSQWRSGLVRPLCVFDSRPLDHRDKVTVDMAWSDIPTCKSQGLDVEYLMLRGIFLTPGAARDHVAYYVDLMRRVRATAEWRDFMRANALNAAFLTGDEFARWLGAEEFRHAQALQAMGGLVAAMPPPSAPARLPQAAQSVPPAQPAPQQALPQQALPQQALPQPPAVAPVASRPSTDTAPPPGAIVGRERRVALIIANSAYQSVPALANPARDARQVEGALRRVGFQSVVVATNQTREQLGQTLINFAREAEKADWSVVYYAGHGIEVGGVNYLIPVDARLKSDVDVRLEAVPLDSVLGAVERASKLRLVMLDACRDNPFASQMRRTSASRSVGRGLAQVEPEAGTLVVYAAKHGETALDGEGDNSPFVSAFVKNLAVPGLEIRKLFDLVRDDVLDSTGRRQQPFSYGSLSGRQDFFFLEKPAAQSGR